MIDTFHVMKQETSTVRYRYRIDGEDYGIRYLKTLDKFKLKYSKNMTAKDIAKVEEMWGTKIIKENEHERFV